MTATLGLWPLMGLAVLACLIGFLFGILAMWHPEDTGPRHSPPPPGEQAPALPRAGLFPTAPQSLLSDHLAVMARDEAEIRVMTRQAERLFGRPGFLP